MENKTVITFLLLFLVVVVSLGWFMKNSIVDAVTKVSKGYNEFSSIENHESLFNNKDDSETSIDDNMYMISHSEYWSGENGQVITRLLDYQGNAITDANCTVDILYPNKTYFKEDEQSLFSIDSYYYDFITPDIEGVYEYKVSCLYQGGVKERSVMNSFHLSPALNLNKVINQTIADLVSQEMLHYNNIQSNLSIINGNILVVNNGIEEIKINLSEISQTTDEIRDMTTEIVAGMVNDSEAEALQQEVLDQLGYIEDFCGNNYTINSSLCQWVNETKTKIDDVEDKIDLINESIEVIIDQNQYLINQTEIIINQTANIIINVNQTVSKLLNDSLAGINSNISNIQDDLDYLKDFTNESFIDIEEQIDSLQNNFSNLQNDIANVNVNVLANNDTMNARFDSLDLQMISLLNEINKIENKLDCNDTINILCDKIDVVVTQVVQINVTSNFIEDYLTGVLTEYLQNLSNQSSGVDGYLFKGVPEIDLLIDGRDTDLVRSGGFVEFTVELVRPDNSTGIIELYIDNVLNASGVSPLVVSKFMTQGEYNIKAKFLGDDDYSITTERSFLEITSTNSLPSVFFYNPISSSVIDLPYNITFNIVDDNNDDVDIILNSGGVYYSTVATGLDDTDNYYYWNTTTPSGNYDLIIRACEVGTSDLYCVNNSHSITLNNSCLPEWVVEDINCSLNNTYFKVYVDVNNCSTSLLLPIDNGTDSYCNYCEADLSEPNYIPVECPTNQTQFRWYTDDNYDSCCVVTGLLSDCPTDFPPYDNATVSCNFLDNEIELIADAEPYLTDKIDIYAQINSSLNVTKCFTYVESENGLLQNNPVKEEYSESLMFAKEVETREYFQPVKGRLNAYYTPENLVPAKEFILGVSCTLSDGNIISGEKYVTPKYVGLEKVTARAVWSVQESPTLVPVIVGIIFTIIILAFLIKIIRKK